MPTQELTKTPLLQSKGLAAYGLYAAAGVVVGLFSGLFGVGGGILMVPFLIIVAGFAPQQANSISLVAMVFAAISGAVKYYQGQTLTPAMLLVALALGLGAIPGAQLGAGIAQRLPKNTLSALFAMFIVMMAVRIMPATGARDLGLHQSSLSSPAGGMLILVGALVLAIGVRMVLTR